MVTKAKCQDGREWRLRHGMTSHRTIPFGECVSILVSGEGGGHPTMRMSLGFYHDDSL